MGQSRRAKAPMTLADKARCREEAADTKKKKK